MRRPLRPAQDLRRAIEVMPTHMKQAMLTGIRENSIIVGAWADRRGGVCPMLAAQRAGDRQCFQSFVHAWDHYTRATTRPRPATERELRTLVSMLETSLMTDDAPKVELAEVVADVRAAKRAAATMAASSRRRARKPRVRRDTGETTRLRELSGRPGWAWLRVFRRHDEYEAALAGLRHAEREAASDGDGARELERV